MLWWAQINVTHDGIEQKQISEANQLLPQVLDGMVRGMRPSEGVATCATSNS